MAKQNGTTIITVTSRPGSSTALASRRRSTKSSSNSSTFTRLSVVTNRCGVGSGARGLTSGKIRTNKSSEVENDNGNTETVRWHEAQAPDLASGERWVPRKNGVLRDRRRL